MFFLGAFTNIFIYLLVSGFFAACLFVKDETVTFETIQNVRVINAVTEEQFLTCQYVVYSHFQESEEDDYCEGLFTLILYSPPLLYDTPYLGEGGLRAPPVQC